MRGTIGTQGLAVLLQRPASQEEDSLRRSPTGAATGELAAVELPHAPSPTEALGRLEGLPGRVLLHSAGPRGRYSFLAAVPRAVLVTRAGETRVLEGDGARAGPIISDPFTGLEQLLARFGSTPSPGVGPFSGGMVGFLSYECGRYLERLPAPPPDDLGMPEAWFGVYDCAVVWDRVSGRCIATGADRGDGKGMDRLQAICARLHEEGKTAVSTGAGTPPAGTASGGRVPLTSALSRSEFLTRVERIRAYVRAGDLFQANLTRRIDAPTQISGEELYRRLLAESPAEFSAYLDTGEGEVASISPELFLSVRDGKVRTGPIKGTAPRGKNEEEDRALSAALAASAKDRAENVMIVDLLRNDFSRVCRAGSIRVPRLAELETLPTVHHLVSSVTGVLEPAAGAVDLLRATFPGGSITGAPKIRAMEILSELEPVRRGVYTGALGILSFDGSMDLSVAIRTAVVRDGRASYGTGAGITLPSDAEAEWQETEEKALAFVRAIGAA
ncbi:MAG: aminodeoxychorismate synthase component I [Gemmatimonadetes bacterium]|nr:aminodeoxychorismate synthase component I [Gemmatimonadota bacterium]